MSKTFWKTLKLALSTTRPDESQAIEVLMLHLTGVATRVGAKVYRDAANNLWVDLGGETVFTAHLDTVSPRETPVQLCMTDGIMSSDGNAVMGADDGAGIAVLAGLIAARKPGLYIFTQGEESGGHGARHIASTYAGVLRQYKRAIAFDRKGTVDICGSQCVGVLASDEFVDTLSARLGMGHRWADGLYTDNAEFDGLIPEIVNIACGYERNHSKHETLDTNYLFKLYQAAVRLDWDALPTIGVQTYAAGLEFEEDDAELLWLVERTAEDLCIPISSYDYSTLEEAMREAWLMGKGVRV